MGSAVQRIEFLETLGKGGFGSVYLANVTRSDHFVQRLAVKLMSADLRDEDDLVARQRDEARLLAQLNHDHIVKVMDMTEIHGLPALIMEYVEGADCHALVRTGAFSVRATIEVVQATASALAAAWTTPCTRTGKPLCVIHRDIKPSNLLISRHGGLKVLDFGVARAEFDREGKTTAVQFGTARFMAPEQWLFGGLSHGVDIYALGISTLELLTGKISPRFPLDRTHHGNEVQKRTEALDFSQQDPKVAKEIRQLLSTMLAFNPGDRPSAAELQFRCSSLQDLIRGTRLEHLARERIPQLIKDRRELYRRDPMLSDFHVGSVEHGTQPEPFPGIETECEFDPGSENTLSRLSNTAPSGPHGLWIALSLCLFALAGGGLGAFYLNAENAVPAHSESQPEPVRLDRESTTEANNSKWPTLVRGSVSDPGGDVEEVGSETIETPSHEPDLPPSPRQVSTVEAPSPADSPTTQESPSERDPIEVTRTETSARPVGVTLISDPWGATASLDGEQLGVTPIMNLALPPGTYHLDFELNEQHARHSIHVLEGRANKFQWKSQTNQLITLEGD